MATLNLAHVTLSLRSLLHKNVRRLLGGVAPSQLVVSLMPPERVEASVPTLNLHLYHIAEDPHFRNAVGAELAVPPVAGQPMALRLYYILTPHLTASDVFDAETQQQLMGLAMKTFHDHPVITDALSITPSPGEGPQPVIDPGLAGGDNRIEIALRPLEPEETVNFWSAEDQKTPRLSAFYEVRTIFLRPEPPARAAGTVFDLGLYVRSAAAARLVGSRAVLPFTMPAATGMGAQSLDMTPARATLQPATVAGKPRIRITGQNLTIGDARLVTLRQADGPAQVLDPALNPDWALDIAPDEIGFVPQPAFLVDDGAGGTASVPVLPGFLVVGLTIRNFRFQGTARLASDYDAGRVAVSLGAHLTGFSGPDADGRFRLDVSDAVDLLALGQDVDLAVAGRPYEQVAAFPAPPEDRGTFRVLSDHVIFALHFAAPFTGAHPVQLVVNGAESQPFWVEV